MNTLETYRPSNVEFDIANNSIVPENLGKFENEKEVVDFIHSNLIAINQKITVFRFMDNFEKTEIRKDYADLLENKIPFLEKELQKATQEFNIAKKKLGESQEYVNATINEAKALAMEVKRGVKEINLDDQFTWRVPFDNKYFFFTFIDNQLKLCKISDIPDHEKSEIWSKSSENEVFFNTNFEEKDE